MSKRSQLKTEKHQKLLENPLFGNLCSENKEFILSIMDEFKLTHQDIQHITDYTTDFEMWSAGLLQSFWKTNDTDHLQGKNRKKEIIRRLHASWDQLKIDLPDYHHSNISLGEKKPISFRQKETNDPIMGTCPVFSEKTRCCNLQTLDAVMNCGYECTYCSIQSFYHGEEIVYQSNLKEKLKHLKFDPNQLYHIGTGQSSDSLLWGNKNNILDDLFAWIKKHPNIILELKTKSSNIHYLLEHTIPPNVLVTWSLNTETIIKNEEWRTTSLDARIASARKIADKGNLVGFHLHPIVAYQGWEADYPKLVNQLTRTFHPDEVALVSMGTLTFIKPVIKQLRQHKINSKILQMPFEDAAGKTSYPKKIKEQFFKTVYDAFESWHQKVFFYLCMEDTSLWPQVFGYEYKTNKDFEDAMKESYMSKINQIKSSK